MRKIMKRLRLFDIVIVVMGLCAISPTYAQVDETAQPQLAQYMRGEILVKFKDGVEPQSVLKDADLEIKGIKRVHSIEPIIGKVKEEHEEESKLKKDSKGWYWYLGKNYKETDLHEELFQKKYDMMPPLQKALYRSYKVDLQEEATVEEAIAALEENPDIEHAEPNYLRYIKHVPNDPLYSRQWSHKRAQAESGWDVERGCSSIIIAIVDTGVDYNHEDLALNIWRDWRGNPGRDFVDIGIDDLPMGLYAIEGEDYADIDDDPSDFVGHGTFVAGIAGAVGNNGRGIAGVCHRCKIMPLRAGYAVFSSFLIGETGIFSSDAVAQAIRYAADNGADIINMSFGGNKETSAERDAVDYAYSKGVVLVAATGNEGRSVDGHYPAAFSKVMAVTSTAEDDLLAAYSNYGSSVDVAAPGGDKHAGSLVLSTVPKTGGYITDPSGYRSGGGTSAASPYVAGLAGLILSDDPGLTNNEVREVIRSTADDLGEPGFDIYYGYGRVNVARALGAPTEPPDTPTIYRKLPVYRFWNQKNSAHFYTISEQEKDKVIAEYSAVYIYEDVAFYVYSEQAPSTVPVYRFFNRMTGSHFYTINEAEKDKLITQYTYVFAYEGPVFYVHENQAPSTTPVHRFFNVTNGCHFYTDNDEEKDWLIDNYSHIFVYEGVCFYVYPRYAK